MCPHESGTDAREAFNVVFPKELNELDLHGSDVADKARNVVRDHADTANGGTLTDAADAVGTCVSFYVEVVNETPYGDNMEMLMELTPPTDSNMQTGITREGMGYNDITGITMTSGVSFSGVSAMQELPILLDDQRKRYRVDLCPQSGDDRDFITRGARMQAMNDDLVDPRTTTDKDGTDFNNGYVYCNLGIKVWSKCEYEYWASSYVKGKNRADDDHMCADANPLVGAMETSSSCYTPVLDNIFDGVDFGGAQYVYEEPLTQMVHVRSTQPATHIVGYLKSRT